MNAKVCIHAGPTFKINKSKRRVGLDWIRTAAVPPDVGVADERAM